MPTRRNMIKKAMNERKKHSAYDREKRVAELRTKKLLTGPEAAEYLNLSYPTFRNIVNSGGIAFVNLGKSRRFTIEILDNFINNQYCQYEEN